MSNDVETKRAEEQTDLMAMIRKLATEQGITVHVVPGQTATVAGQVVAEGTGEILGDVPQHAQPSADDVKGRVKYTYHSPEYALRFLVGLNARALVLMEAAYYSMSGHGQKRMNTGVAWMVQASGQLHGLSHLNRSFGNYRSNFSHIRKWEATLAGCNCPTRQTQMAEHLVVDSFDDRLLGMLNNGAMQPTADLDITAYDPETCKHQTAVVLRVEKFGGKAPTPEAIFAFKAQMERDIWAREQAFCEAFNLAPRRFSKWVSWFRTAYDYERRDLLPGAVEYQDKQRRAKARARTPQPVRVQPKRTLRQRLGAARKAWAGR